MDTIKMNIPTFLHRLWNIHLLPAQEWISIRDEKHNNSLLFWGWSFPLILIMALAAIVGNTVVETQSDFKISHLLLSSFFIIVFSTISLFLSAWVVKSIASQSVSNHPFNAAFRLIAYSYSAGFTANSLAFLFPNYSFLSLLGLYSFYLIWHGLGPILNISKDKKSGYFTFIVIGLITIYVVLGLILTSLLSIYSNSNTI